MLFTFFLFLHSKIITTFAKDMMLFGIILAALSYIEKQKDGITGNGFR